MKILVVGSGGREHALAWALAKSQGVSEIVVCPGNGGTQWEGTAELAPCISLSGDVKDLAPDYDLVVVGPEAPLVQGLADQLKVPVFGPSARAAQVEASKLYAKEIMDRAGVPTAKTKTLGPKDVDQLEHFGLPIVIKDDGLAAGKGVGVFFELQPAQDFFAQLSQSTDRIFIEEYLEGPELSVLAFCDGKEFRVMPPARDYKRRFENGEGPNTGGMGAISPVPDIDDALMKQIETQVLAPVLSGLAKDNAAFVGVLYAGLKLTPEGPKVLEFNCRFGDPETQVILPQFQGNLAKLMLSCAQGKIDDEHIEWSGQSHLGVVVASDGYPANYEKGLPITGLDQSGMPLIFQAGTRSEGDRVLTNGGRVLAVVGAGENLKEASMKAYEGVNNLNFQGMVFRKDIGS